MPKFKYVVKDANGKTITAEVDAFDQAGLVQKLQNQGYFIISVEELIPDIFKSPAEKSQKDKEVPRRFGHKNIKLEDLLTFSRQLLTMLESGVTLLRSLEVIVRQVESRKLFQILSKVTKDVEQGSSLSEALAQHPKTFDQLWVSLVEVGEAAGTMPKVLRKLTFYLEQQAAFRSTIISAIIYPVILFFVCMGAVSFFALFVGPRFESVFSSMNVELPLITRALLSSFRFIKEKFIWLLLTLVGGIFFTKKYTQTPLGKRQFESFLFSLPVMGNVFRLIIVERFSSQMAILVDSGVPILHALDITQRLVSNVTCAQVINDIRESVRQGEMLVAPMERSKFFPSMATQMITVGEETGELSKMLQHVAAFYQETVETFMTRLGTMIEPFMIVFMGAVIGVIVLAMFLPMFNIAQLGGG